MEWVFPLDLYLLVDLSRLLLYQVFVVFKSVINGFVFAEAAKVQMQQNIRSFIFGLQDRVGNVQRSCLD